MNTTLIRLKRINFIAAIFTAILLNTALQCYAQEIMVPLDSAHKVIEISKDDGLRLPMFNTTKGFLGARLFRINATQYAFETLFSRGDTIYKDRKLLSEAEVITLRNKVTKEFESNPATLDQDSRTKLLVYMAAISLGYYGWALPTMLNIDDSKTYIGVYMLTSAAGIIVPFYLTKGVYVPEAAAQLATYGAAAGIAHGFFLAEVLSNNSAKYETAVGLAMGTSILEGIGGYVLAKETKMTAGKAELMSVIASYGTGIGFALAGSFDLYNNSDRKTVFAMALGGSALGYLSGNFLANQHKYSAGDARVMNCIVALGAYTPIAIVKLADPESFKPYFTFSILGTLGGIGLGHYMLQNKEFSGSEGIYTTLGTIGGAAFGAGIGYLLSSSNSGKVEDAVMLGTALGGLGGFSSLYFSFSDDAVARDKNLSNFKLDFYPENIAGAFLIKDLNKSIPFEKQVSLPLLRASYSF